MSTTDLSVEDYALEHGRLHPQAVAFLTQYFDIDLGLVKVNAKHGKTSALGTAVWVLADTIMAERGKLNAKFEQWPVELSDGRTGYNSNRAIDLATVHGMLILAHECYHVKQWLTRPWWSSVFTWFGDMFRSLWFKRRLWSHGYSKWEFEAIEFQRSIARDISLRRAELEIFEALR